MPLTGQFMAKKTTRVRNRLTIPIVFLGVVSDPVSLGLVDSLASPGGNITGFTSIGGVLAGKQLELLKETIPKLSRVAVLWNPQNAGSTQVWKESQPPAKELGLQLHSMAISSILKRFYKGNTRSLARFRLDENLVPYGIEQYRFESMGVVRFPLPVFSP